MAAAVLIHAGKVTNYCNHESYQNFRDRRKAHTNGYRRTDTGSWRGPCRREGCRHLSLRCTLSVGNRMARTVLPRRCHDRKGQRRWVRRVYLRARAERIYAARRDPVHACRGNDVFKLGTIHRFALFLSQSTRRQKGKTNEVALRPRSCWSSSQQSRARACRESPAIPSNNVGWIYFFWHSSVGDSLSLSRANSGPALFFEQSCNASPDSEPREFGDRSSAPRSNHLLAPIDAHSSSPRHAYVCDKHACVPRQISHPPSSACHAGSSYRSLIYRNALR